MRRSSSAQGEDLVVVVAGEDGFVREERTSFDVEELPGYGASGHAAVADLLAAIDEGRDPARQAASWWPPSRSSTRPTRPPGRSGT